jgi:hypothetical protein
VGHDDHARVREHAVERRDELAFCCSIHWALSGWRNEGPPVAPVAQGLRLAPGALERRSRKPCPPARAEGALGEMVRTEPFARVSGRRNGLPRLCRPSRIKPGRTRPAPAVSDRTWPDEPKGDPSARRPVTAHLWSGLRWKLGTAKRSACWKLETVPLSPFARPCQEADRENHGRRRAACERRVGANGDRPRAGRRRASGAEHAWTESTFTPGPMVEETAMRWM